MTRLTFSAQAGLVLLLCQLFVVGAFSANDPWDIEVVDSGVPATIAAGETTVARVTLGNRGTEEWDPGKGFAVAAHWLSVDGEVVSWEGARTALDAVVLPGADVTIEATLTAPSQIGDFVVQWDVLQEGAFWIAERDPSPVLGFPVKVYRDYSFELVDHSLPRFLWAGSRVKVGIVLKNNGAVDWAADETFGAVGHWRRIGRNPKTVEGPRARFSEVVKPGEKIELDGILDVPDIPGPWLLEWDVVREGVCFFSRRMDETPPAALAVVVPELSEAWICVLLTGLIFVGAWRRTGRLRRFSGVADLVWLVVVPFAVERSVVEAGLGGGIVSFLCLAALASIVALTGEKIRPWLAWAVGWMLIVIFVGDRVYRRFFVDLPSVGSLDTMGQTDEIGRSIISLFETSDVIYLLVGFAGGFVALGVRAFVPSFRRRVAAATVFCFLAGGGLWWASELAIHRQVFRRVFVARETGVIAAHLLDFGRAGRDSLRHRTVATAEVDRIEQWFRGTAGNRRGVGPAFGLARGMNLVMIQAESVQSFVVGLEVGGQLVMPNLTRWAAEGQWFTEVSDQTGHGRSSDAELISQTSLLPLADGAAAFQTVNNRYTSLAGVLSGKGYQTLSAVPFDRAFWNRGDSHRAYGYQTSLFGPDFEPGRWIGWGLGDRDFLSQMGDRLVELPRPFCAWLLTLSLHHPFEGFPDDLEELNAGHWTNGPVGEYLHTMHYLDQALGDLESRLDSAGLLEQTVIVVWGDHDAGFEWQPEIANLMGVSPDQPGWYRSQRVPLIIKAPEHLELVGPVEVPGGHLDIAPTVAGILGIDSSQFAWMGRNLLADPGEQPVVGEYDCWTTRTHVFLQGDNGTLQGGRCLERPSLSRRPAEECSDDFDLARDRIAVSQNVLRFDLQERLTARLGAEEQ